MADVAYWDDSFESAIKELEDVLLSFDGLSMDEQTDRFYIAEDRLKRIKSVRKSFNLELRQITDQGRRATYNAKLRGYDQEVKKLEGDMARIKARVEHIELTGTAAESKDNNSYLAATENIQDETERALDRTKQLVENANDVADETIDELKRQREQINSVTNQLITMEDSIEYADKLLKDFSKRMMTDKCIQVFAMLNMVVLIVVIIVAIMSQNGYFDDDGTSNDDLPRRLTETGRRLLRGSSHRRF